MAGVEAEIVLVQNYFVTIFCTVESGMFLRGVIKHNSMVWYGTTVKLVRTIVRRRWPRSLYHMVCSHDCSNQGYLIRYPLRGKNEREDIHTTFV